MNKKKVLIGLPAFDGADPAALEGFICLAYNLGRREPNYDFYLRVVGGKEQFRARNVLVNMAIGCGMDYLLMLDGDQIVPNDAFSKLIAHRKDIIGGLYLQKLPPYRPVILRETRMVPGKYDFQYDYTYGLNEVDVIGGGCMLLSVAMLKRIPEPYFVPEVEKGTDIQICEKARALGYKIYVDTTVEIGHIADPQVIFPRDVPKDQRKEFGAANPEHVRKLDRVSSDLCRDIREYLSLSPEQYDKELNTLLGSQVNMWEAKPRRTNKEVHSFYREYERVNVIRQTYYNRYSVWAQSYNHHFMDTDWLKSLGIRTVLDYGCGISLFSKTFVEDGFDYTCADIEDTLQLRFLEWRRSKYGFPLQIVGVNERIQLPKEYDLIMLWDVIEHLYNPWEVLDTLINDHLNTPGYLMTNVHLLAFEQFNNPQHLVKINQVDFTRDVFTRYGLVTDYNRPYLFRR